MFTHNNRDVIDRFEHDICQQPGCRAPPTKFCYLEAGSIMIIFSPFIMVWNVPSIWAHLITSPYPVIIDEPGFLLLVRGSGGNSNGAGVDNVIECAVSGAHSFQRDFRTCAVIGCTETTPIDSVGRNSILDLTSPR